MCTACLHVLESVFRDCCGLFPFMFTSEYISVIHMNQISGWKVDGIGNQVRRNFTWGAETRTTEPLEIKAKMRSKQTLGLKLPGDRASNLHPHPPFPLCPFMQNLFNQENIRQM